MTYSFIPISNPVFSHALVSLPDKTLLAECLFKPQAVYKPRAAALPVVCKHSLEMFSLLQKDYPGLGLSMKPLEVEVDGNAYYLDASAESIRFSLIGDVLRIDDGMTGQSFILLVLRTEETEDSTYITDYIRL